MIYSSQPTNTYIHTYKRKHTYHYLINRPLNHCIPTNTPSLSNSPLVISGMGLTFSALTIALSILAQNLSKSTPLGIRQPPCPGGNFVTFVRPNSPTFDASAECTPSVTTSTRNRSPPLSSKISGSQIADTARGSCKGGPAVMEKTSA